MEIALSPEIEGKLQDQARRDVLLIKHSIPTIVEEWQYNRLRAAATVAVEGMGIESWKDAVKKWEGAAQAWETKANCLEIELVELRRLPVYEKTTPIEAGNIIRHWLEMGQHFGDGCMVPLAQFVDKLIEKRLPQLAAVESGGPFFTVSEPSLCAKPNRDSTGTDSTAPLPRAGGGMTIERHIQCLTDECFPITDRLTFEKLAGQHLRQAVAEAVIERNRTNNVLLQNAEKRHAKELQEAVAERQRLESGMCADQRLKEERGRHAVELAQEQKRTAMECNAKRSAEASLVQERANWEAKIEHARAYAAVADAYEEAARKMDQYGMGDLIRHLASERAAKSQEPVHEQTIESLLNTSQLQWFADTIRRYGCIQWDGNMDALLIRGGRGFMFDTTLSWTVNP